MKWAEQIAFGPLHLLPQQFEELQPIEFWELYDGWQWRKERQEDMTAFFVCHILNTMGKIAKRPITPKQILKPLRKTSKEDDRKYLMKRFNLPESTL